LKIVDFPRELSEFDKSLFSNDENGRLFPSASGPLSMKNARRFREKGRARGRTAAFAFRRQPKSLTQHQAGTLKITM